MLPKEQGGNDAIDNAIPVCFECHAEIHCYNDKHPKGRKFMVEELKAHKEQWLKVCEENPAALIDNPRDRDVGPLQGMLDELRFNLAAVQFSQSKRETTSQSDKVNNRGCLLKEKQFEKAMEEGVLSMIDDGLCNSIMLAYTAISRASESVHAENNQSFRDKNQGHLISNAVQSLKDAEGMITTAVSSLSSFLNTNAAPLESTAL